MTGLKIVDASAKVPSNHGDIIVILQQYAYYGRGRTIHSAGQMEHFKTAVHDRSMKVGGHQCIRTLEGYILPLNIINGLPYLGIAMLADATYCFVLFGLHDLIVRRQPEPAVT